MKRFVERVALSKICAVAAVAACGAFAAHADMTVAQAVDSGFITWANATTNWVPNATDPTLSDLVVKFTDTASAGTLTIDDMIEAGADYLVVAGGGAGGTSTNSTNGAGGGGGGGGLAIVSNATFVAGTYTATVGAGGVAATTYATPQPGGNGGDSILAFPDSTAVTMKGGGGGGAASQGSDGGSGGGGSFYGSGTLSGGSAVDADYGNDGGSSSGAKFSAGGGGAGAAGKNGNKTASGRGGLGVTNYIAGVMNIYAAGGAGGKNANNTGIKGGANNEYGNGGAKNASATAGEDGTGGGGGGGGAYVDAVANGLGANGGSGAVIVRLTSARVVRITMPSATDWTYDGTMKTGVVENASYVLSGDWRATDKGVHTATVTPASGASWLGDGGKYPSNIVWTISAMEVEPPTARADTPTYTGASFDGFVDSSDSAWYSLSGEPTATDAGAHGFTAALNDPANTVWSDGTTADKDFAWSVAQAANSITSLSIKGWKLGGAENAPECTATFGQDTVQYAYAADAGATEWSDSVPTEPGLWYVRATIPETGNWTGATEYASFYLWSSPEDIFRDSAVITVTGYSGSAPLTNFPVLVRLADNSPAGFEYMRAGYDPANMAFVQGDELLQFDVDTWNTLGESAIWVSLPVMTNGTQFTMYWNLKDGKTAPAVDGKKVWSDYAGVWHMNDASDSSYGASSGELGNKTQSTDGFFGGALSANQQGEPLILATASDAVNALADGAFTVSFWTKYNSVSRGTASQYIFSRRRVLGDTGYALCINGPKAETATQFIMCFGTTAGARYSIGDTNPMTKSGSDKWVRNDVIFTSSRFYWYINGTELYWTRDMSSGFGNGTTGLLGIGGLAAKSSDSNINGAMDEFRMKAGATPVARIAAEYAAETRDDFLSFGLVVRDGKKVNRWAKDPSVDPAEWDKSAPPSSVAFDAGTLVEGSVQYTIRSLYSGDVYSTIDDVLAANVPGVYQIDFTMTDEDGYEHLQKTMFVYVRGPVSYSGIQGNLGDSGRVLLMNRDSNTTSPIRYQSHAATSTGNATYWTWVRVEELSNDWNLQDETESILRANGGTRLWHLYDCRHGNTHYTHNNKSPNPLPSQLESDQNYLPFSSDAYRFNSESGKAGSNNGYAAQIVMRNTTNAWVTSSCLADGIGTVYFDAVNGWTSAGGEEYKIAVEYSVATENGDAPYDEFIDDPVPVYDDKEKFVATNHYPNVVWRRAEIEAYNTETGNTIVTNELPLAISTGGSKDRFYRVTARLNTRVPTRFRICRTSSIPPNITSIDEGGFILLDNIVASPPPMTAELSSPGYHAEDKDGNEALRGKRAVGWAGAFSTAFPRKGETNVYAAATVSYVTNGVLGALSPAQLTNFVGGATMHYRWRCLDQRLAGSSGEWRTVKLNPLDGLKSIYPIDLPGFACDVEYWYDAHLQAPFYKYYNYSGSTAASGWSYSEDVSAATNHAYDAVARIFESKGTNWYVRLRDGSSAYQGARVLTRPAGGTTETAWEMDLVGNHIWRGFVQTTEAVTGGLDFRFETYNPQSGGWAEYNFETNCLCAATNMPFASIPISDLVEPATTTAWANVVCDATTGYLLFQLDDSTHSLTIAHADYQNFNKWHDAHKADGKFKGNSTEDDAKSGTSPKTRDFSNDFSSWTDTPSTNDTLWAESFKKFNSSGQYEGKGPYEPFKTIDTPNGWASGPGMWSYAKYMSDAGDMALQMSGGGDGWMQYVGPEGAAPRGIEKVSFRARLAQPISFETMSYSFADGASVKSNYTFFAQMSLTDAPTTVNYDGDGTVSAIAYYRPKNGCYEFRVSRYSSTHTQMSIYRWSPGADDSEVSATLLAQQNFASLVDALHMGGTDTTPTYGGLFISCENLSDGTRIVAGIRNGLDVIMSPSNAVSKAFVGLVCTDTSTSRLNAGSYGLTSKNCPAVICNPRHWNSALTAPSKSGNASAGDCSDKYYFNQTTCNLGGGGNADPEASKSLRRGDWAVERGRFDVDTSTDSTYLRAKARPQRVEVQWTKAGSATEWKPLGTNVVSSYTMSTPYEQHFWTTEPASVRLKTVDGDKGGDVVVDDVRICQWAGCDMGSRDANGTEYFADGDGQRGYVTNFYFSSCWVTNGMVRMSAKRTRTGDVCSLRAPLMDGGGSPSRGIGLGMISFEYYRAQTNTVLWLQVATNVTDSLANYNKDLDPSLWTTVTNFTFKGLQQAELDHGTRSYYLGIHGVPGVMRLVLATNVVADVKGVRDEDAFGEIDITELFCRDEPELDVTCWWGWNLRMFGADALSQWDDGLRSHLPDWTFSSSGLGLSLALNNSTTEDVVKGHESDYTEHMPFVQTPTFTSNIVGEVSFKARKFALSDPAQPGEIALYGASSGDVTYDANWKELARFVVTNTFYETFSWQSVGDTYRAFRLGVTGVKGVTDPASRGSDPTEGSSPVRVMIDEVAVFEAVRPTMGFRYVYPFRTILDETRENTNVVDGAWMPLPDEQPLAEESWTIQAEIVARQLPDEIDLATPGHEPRVFFRWYKGTDYWGYENWKLLTDADKCGYAELARADGETMVFRGSVPLAPGALVAWNPDVDFVPMVVQYAAEVVYWNVNGSVQTNALTASEWTRPAWYDPVDYNQMNPKSGFSAFTILDTISPERVWINEVNVHDGLVGAVRLADTNQYVEIAVPRRQPITNWKLKYVDNGYVTNTICTFGGVSGQADTKTMHETNEYVFVTVQSPATAKAGTLSAAAGEVDGTWANFDMNGGKLEERYPIAFMLVRPSGVVEQAIVLEGTNYWKGTRYEGRYSVTNIVAKLNGGPGGEFYFVGDEAGTAAACSLGVTNGTGAAVEDWTNLMAKTPGRANVGQFVPEGYVIYASGSMLALRGKVGADGRGHVRQKFADAAEFVLDDVLAMVLKGGDGTNIVYDVDQWWEIKSVTTNGVPVPELAGRTGTFPFAAGVGQSNDVEVVATAQPRVDLRTKYGLDENNRYTTAVMAWLAGGATKKYGPFAGSDITDDAWFGGIYDLTTTITNLTLTERYWLDIDPTDPGWVLRAGIVGSPTPVPFSIGGLSGDTYITNVRMTMQMAITNENTSSVHYGDSYAPYVLRGAAPGDCSDDFSDVWTSVTFKVVADLQNDKPMRKRWVPLRRFAFDAGSFDSDNRAVIDVWDPFSVRSSATSGWDKWSGCQIFYSWSIDDKGGQDAPQILKPDSTYP